jgi:2-oxoglutarate ferredoxin oxidoreductase subunit alpha
MSASKNSRIVMMDGSEIIIEACVQAGADAYVNYPITPSNWLNMYASKRFPVFAPAPDEITTLQWLTGMATTGRIPVTSTSFPGYALMIETMNMAFMMEMPLLVILVQRLGPSTGSATVGAEGDLMVLNGTISGGYNFPVFCISNLDDCMELTAKALKVAVELRTPVVLLTSKEMVMTTRSFDISKLADISPVKRNYYDKAETYLPYDFGDDLIPAFLPVGNNKHQVRINSSTHDKLGVIRKATPEAINNTKRLRDKIENRVAEFTFYDFDSNEGDDIVIVTYGITSDPARDALIKLRNQGKKVSLLVIKTMLPVPQEVISIIDSFRYKLFAEENLPGLLVRLLYGYHVDAGVRQVNSIGKMITPSDIIKEVELWK